VPIQTTNAAFVFMTCQVGAELALKQEVAREWPSMRFAFSRPGFLTFKIAPGKKFPKDFASRLVFARAAGFCLGKATGGTPSERADQVCKLIGSRPVTQLHVWARDRSAPGFRDYEPGLTPEAAEVERVIRERAVVIGSKLSSVSDLQASVAQSGARSQHDAQRDPPCPPLRRGGDKDDLLVADVVIVDEKEWWVGFHYLHSAVAEWPGGFWRAALPTDAVSRAYLKMQEAVLWSGFHVKPGERCVEIGSAPGGASQFLLAQGLDVIGIDPAQMDRVVSANPQFRHIRKRSKEVPRSEFVDVDWLTCDVNLPPNYTLDTVKAIVSHPGVRFQGMLLTLKLVEWSLAEEIPKYLERVRSWGFRTVRARQLHHNRQEICVAASGFRPASSEPDESPKTNRARAPRPQSSGKKSRAPDRRRKRAPTERNRGENKGRK